MKHLCSNGTDSNGVHKVEWNEGSCKFLFFPKKVSSQHFKCLILHVGYSSQCQLIKTVKLCLCPQVQRKGMPNTVKITIQSQHKSPDPYVLQVWWRIINRPQTNISWTHFTSWHFTSIVQNQEWTIRTGNNINRKRTAQLQSSMKLKFQSLVITSVQNWDPKQHEINRQVQKRKIPENIRRLTVLEQGVYIYFFGSLSLEVAHKHVVLFRVTQLGYGGDNVACWGTTRGKGNFSQPTISIATRLSSFKNWTKCTQYSLPGMAKNKQLVFSLSTMFFQVLFFMHRQVFIGIARARSWHQKVVLKNSSNSIFSICQHKSSDQLNLRSSTESNEKAFFCFTLPCEVLSFHCEHF